MAQLTIFMRKDEAGPDPVIEASRFHYGDVIEVHENDKVFGQMEPGPHTLLIQMPKLHTRYLTHLIEAEMTWQMLDVMERGVALPRDLRTKRLFCPRLRSVQLRDPHLLPTTISMIRVETYDRATNKIVQVNAPMLAHVANNVRPENIKNWLDRNIVPKRVFPNPHYEPDVMS